MNLSSRIDLEASRQDHVEFLLESCWRFCILSSSRNLYRPSRFQRVSFLLFPCRFFLAPATPLAGSCPVRGYCSRSTKVPADSTSGHPRFQIRAIVRTAHFSDFYCSPVRELDRRRRDLGICGIVSGLRHSYAHALIKSYVGKRLSFVIPRHIFRVRIESPALFCPPLIKSN
jgi:hypothetical protein